MHQDGVTNNYPHRAFTTGRRHISQTKPRPKGNSQTLKQPGKINLKDFSNVTDAIARMTIGEKDEHGPKMMGHAPLATPELVDLGSEYAQVKDVVPNLYPSYDGDYMYALVQDSIGNKKSDLRHRRKCKDLIKKKRLVKISCVLLMCAHKLIMNFVLQHTAIPTLNGVLWKGKGWLIF